MLIFDYFIGTVEKALLVSVYSNHNNNGMSKKEMILAAEIFSCGKRTLARQVKYLLN